MPHLILEYSDNIVEPVDTCGLFGRLHTTLAEIAPCDITQIKSRAIMCDQFVVGIGAAESVFVHLTVNIWSGKTIEKRREIGVRLLEIVKESFARTYAERPCDITVDIREMERETYAKAMNEKAKQMAVRTP